MKKQLAISLAVCILGMAATPAQAFFRRHACCPPPCCAESCAPTCVTYVDKVVTCYKPQWKVRDVSCVVLKPAYREEVTTHKCKVLVPVWTDQKKTITVCSLKPREVEREVTCCKMVPTTVTDCCGCTYTVCRPETFVQKVKCTVWESVPENKDITVKVCSYKEEEKTYQSRRWVCEHKQETVVYKQSYCEMVAYQTTIKVPVCVPVCTPGCD